MAEAILNMRGTGSWTAGGSERPTNFREKILREYPNGPSPFMGILGMLKSEDLDDVKFTIFEQSFPDQIHATTPTGDPTGNGDGVAQSDSTTDAWIVLDDADYTNPQYYFKPGHLVRNETTGEVMLVLGRTATASNDSINVTRGIGFSSTYGDGSGSVGVGLAVSNSDVLTIIGSANIESDNYPEAIHYQPTEKWNFVETFRTSLEISEDAQKTRFRTGNMLENLKYDCAMMHSMELEKAFGRGSTQDRRFMGGFEFFATQNVSSFSSGLTRNAFIDFLRPIYTVPGGSQNKIAFCGAQALGIMTQYAEDLGQIFLEPKDKTYGLQIRTLVHAWGELKLVNHPLLSEHPTWTKNMYIVDTSNVKYRFLNGCDTRYLKDRQGNGELK
ncbi:MAG: SU10 major capsid protein, partial [Planctomycetota bacterium]